MPFNSVQILLGLIPCRSNQKLVMEIGLNFIFDDVQMGYYIHLRVKASLYFYVSTFPITILARFLGKASST